MELKESQYKGEVTQIDYLRSYAPERDRYLCAATIADRSMTCTEVEDLLIEPIADMIQVSDYRSALYAGLQEYVADTSVINKNAQNMDRQTRGGLRDMATDMRRLTNMLQDDAAQTVQERTVRTADENQAVLYAREHLLTMRPVQLIALCNQLNMPIDELGLWKQKGGNRQNREVRMYTLDDLGADSVALRSWLVTKLFTSMDLLSPTGIETIRVHNDDITTLTQEHRQSNFGIKQGPSDNPQDKDWLPRWDVEFPAGGVAKREIVPVFSWATVADPGYSYWERRKKLDWMGSSLQFDERSRTLTLFSPLVGGLLLASALGIKPKPELLGKFFLPNFDPRYANKVRRGKPAYLPDTAVAGMPSIIARPQVMHDIMHSASFKNIENIVVPSRDDMIHRTMRWKDAEAFMNETPPRQWPATGRRLSFAS